jgi:hypothetical protein
MQYDARPGSKLKNPACRRISPFPFVCRGDADCALDLYARVVSRLPFSARSKARSLAGLVALAFPETA